MLGYNKVFAWGDTVPLIVLLVLPVLLADGEMKDIKSRDRLNLRMYGSGR